MDLETLRAYLLEHPATSEGFPFGGEVLVFKVLDKMFALIPLETLPLRINLKCDPVLAIQLREEYDAVEPGFHQNKKHWNTMFLDGRLSDDFVKKWVDHSYERVVSGMTKKRQKELSQFSE